jgi:hypothetical protein
VEFLFWPLSVVYAFDWVSVGGQVQKHANDGGVAPVFDHGRALWIGSKTDRGCWSPIGVAVSHAGCFNDLVDPSLLRVGDCVGDCVLHKLDFLPPARLSSIRPDASTCRVSFSSRPAS